MVFKCRYAASSAMQAMGDSLVAAGETLQHFYQVLSEELELGYLRGKEMKEAALEQQKGLLRLEKGILQQRIAAPLGRNLHHLPTQVRQTLNYGAMC